MEKKIIKHYREGNCIRSNKNRNTFDKIMQNKPVQRCKNNSGSDVHGRERIVVLPKKRTK